LLKTARPESVENAREIYRELQHELQAVPGILEVAWTASNTPYSMQTWTATRILDDGRRFSSAIFPVGDAYADVLDLNVIEGRWFSAEDNASPQQPVVINSRLREELFGDQPAVGALLDDLRVAGGRQLPVPRRAR
jgi:putative ABC transport system permease protein